MKEQFGAFRASELHRPQCQRSQPLREKLLLVLPNGERYEYLCQVCGTSLGQCEVQGAAVRGRAGMPEGASALGLLT